MPENFTPVSVQQIEELLKWTLSENKTLTVKGRGGKTGFGHLMETDCTISLEKLSGILNYDPAELVMQALPGTPLDEIEAALSANNQHLAFEPMRLGQLYNTHAESGSIGGTFMANLSGPRRFKSGAARDHILGIKAVSGRGQAYQSGGMVIKNVTGYDMSKLLTGSWGTLSIITEVIFKVLPAPQTSQSLCVLNQQPEAALALMTKLAQSPHDISGLAYLPGDLSKHFKHYDGVDDDTSLTMIRLEGSVLSVAERLKSVMRLIPHKWRTETMQQEASQQLWTSIRDVSVFTIFGDTPVIMKLSIPPAAATGITDFIKDSAGVHWYMDAAGGWLWISMPEDLATTLIPAIRKKVAMHGGSVVLYSAIEKIKKTVGIFSPQPAALVALNKRIKESFDPENILNPGRLGLV
ncbi:MAG: FAD-binding protein [Gammaproteobacteria bacterium]|nr:FAD-binding protein [Gammaproteobacteria bacterium]